MEYPSGLDPNQIQWSNPNLMYLLHLRSASVSVLRTSQSGSLQLIPNQLILRKSFLVKDEDGDEEVEEEEQEGGGGVNQQCQATSPGVS
jgi:hypothetical protein